MAVGLDMTFHNTPTNRWSASEELVGNSYSYSYSFRTHVGIVHVVVGLLSNGSSYQSMLLREVTELMRRVLPALNDFNAIVMK